MNYCYKDFNNFYADLPNDLIQKSLKIKNMSPKKDKFELKKREEINGS
ncbi:MAG: hypothetical protein GY870_00855 [archaeon]|nr:hypothetical protein [archaeon]